MSTNDNSPQSQQAGTSKDNGQCGIDLLKFPSNPFQQEFPLILWQMGEFAGKEELKNLRQLSKTFYTLMNPRFLEKLEMPVTGYTVIEPDSPAPAISNENAYFFRQLIFEFKSIVPWAYPLRSVESIRLVAPNIKKIVIDGPHNLMNELSELHSLLRDCSKLFTNLVSLQINFSGFIGISYIPIMKEITQLFPQTVQITAETLFQADHLNKYMECYSQLTSFQVKIAARLGIRQKLELDEIAEHLSTNAQFYQSNNNIRFSGAYISLIPEPDTEPEIINSLVMIMSVCNNGGMDLHIEKYDWLSRAPDLLNWKRNISELTLSNWDYLHGLTFLKDFVNLTAIEIWSGDFNAGLFPDPNLTDDENLIQIFEGMWKLHVTFDLDCLKGNKFPRIYPGNPRALTLQQLVHHVDFKGEFWEGESYM